MDYEQLLREYIKRFVLVMETVGQATNNKKYMEVGKCIEDNKDIINQIIQWEPDFNQAIGMLIISLLMTIHEKDEMIGWENTQRVNYYIDDLYTRYLEKPTNAFLKKNGMPTIARLSDHGLFTLVEQFNNKNKKK